MGGCVWGLGGGGVGGGGSCSRVRACVWVCATHRQTKLISSAIKLARASNSLLPVATLDISCECDLVRGDEALVALGVVGRRPVAELELCELLQFEGWGLLEAVCQYQVPLELYRKKRDAVCQAPACGIWKEREWTGIRIVCDAGRRRTTRAADTLT